MILSQLRDCLPKQKSTSLMYNACKAASGNAEVLVYDMTNRILIWQMNLIGASHASCIRFNVTNSFHE